MHKRLPLVAFLLLLTATTNFAAPKPARSEYLLLTQAGITFAEERGAFYLMSFDVLKPSTDRIYVLVQYENPEDPNAPLIDDLFLPPGAKEINLQSPAFKTVRNRVRYKVELQLFADAQHTKLLGKHRQDVDFRAPKDLVSLITQRYGVSVK